VEQTVYLQCWEGYRKDGPQDLQCVGETEWVAAIAARARQRPQAAQIGAMMGTTDLRSPRAREVLEAHCAASSLFRGIRQIAAWDTSSDVLFIMEGVSDPNLYGEPSFRAGFKVLSEMGLRFDAWHYHPQTPHLTALARAFPTTPIVLDHLGTPVGIGQYAGHEQEVYSQWARDLSELASCANVSIKLGGMAMPWNGFGFERAAQPPSSDMLVEKWARYFHHAIDQFGPERCMFESNFPVDKCATTYASLWNAYKKMAARYSDAEQDSLFHGTAARFYGLT
jgi:predicted TIM-barrel fold metal-dependent hydrolase